MDHFFYSPTFSNLRYLIFLLVQLSIISFYLKKHSQSLILSFHGIHPKPFTLHTAKPFYRSHQQKKQNSAYLLKMLLRLVPNHLHGNNLRYLQYSGILQSQISLLLFAFQKYSAHKIFQKFSCSLVKHN